MLTGPSTDDPFLNVYRRRRSAAFVEIHTDTELIGIGETYLGYHMPRVIPELVDYYRPILVEGGTLDIPRLRQRMIDCGMYWSRVGVGHTVIAGIEAALWDLKG